MSIKDQFKKLTDNWLLILISLVLLFMILGGSSWISSLARGLSSSSDYEESSSGYERPPPMGFGGSGNYGSESYVPEPVGSSGVNSLMKDSVAPAASDVSAPPVKEQMIAKTATMETTVERGTFPDEEATLKSIVKVSDASVLWQNVQTYGEGRAQYRAGRYQLKIDSRKYDAIVAQLKAIGKIQSFVENANDLTKSYTDLKIQLENEKKRLERYEQMYKEASLTEDKIDISDRILNEENWIKSLEENLENAGDQVVYSTIDITITEMKSGYAELTFVKLSGLVKAFVGSVSGFIYVFIVLLPWALGLWLIVFVVRKIRGTGKKKAINKK